MSGSKRMTGDLDPRFPLGNHKATCIGLLRDSSLDPMKSHKCYPARIQCSFYGAPLSLLQNMLITKKQPKIKPMDLKHPYGTSWVRASCVYHMEQLMIFWYLSHIPLRLLLSNEHTCVSTVAIGLNFGLGHPRSNFVLSSSKYSNEPGLIPRLI